MLCSCLAYMNYRKLKTAYDNQILERYQGSGGGKKLTGGMMALAVTLVILIILFEILLIVAGIYFVVRCSRVKKWPAWATILLILLMFIIPGPTAIVMIIYGLIACGGKKGGNGNGLGSRSRFGLAF